MEYGILNLYLELIILCLIFDFHIFYQFITTVIPEVVSELSINNCVDGKILKVSTVIMFVLLYPIMISVILIKGAEN